MKLVILRHTDSCVGATIEYYDDASCSSFAGLSELDAYEDQCAQSGFEHDHAVFQSLRCTTAARPPAPPYAYVVQYVPSYPCTNTFAH